MIAVVFVWVIVIVGVIAVINAGPRAARRRRGSDSGDGVWSAGDSGSGGGHHDSSCGGGHSSGCGGGSSCGGGGGCGGGGD